MSHSHVSRRCVSLQIVPQQLTLQFPLPTMMQLGNTVGSGLILGKQHYAELVGWGSAVGGVFDVDVRYAIALGQPNWVRPETFQARQEAYTTRVHWLKLVQKLTLNPVPLRRAFGIFYYLEKYFGIQAAQQVPDEVLGQLVGVLPETIAIARKSRNLPPAPQPLSTLQPALSQKS
ncbi:MAG: hypothetical protein F6K32_01595 [Desertifilum sp. SIO1I2]|nr:hypothetical protein [Desertifilum sp. SIO1I2]